MTKRRAKARDRLDSVTKPKEKSLLSAKRFKASSHSYKPIRYSYKPIRYSYKPIRYLPFDER